MLKDVKSNLTTWLAVFVGAGLGAVARYAISTVVQSKTASVFPIGTLVVNVTGSLLIGAVMTVLIARQGSDQLRLLLVTGVLGGYTTFSAFAYESLQLLERKHAATAIVYILTTNTLCLAACGLAYFLTKRLISPSS